MQRSKIRKAVNALPAWMPPKYLEDALDKVTNGVARAKIRSRYQRAETARQAA